MPKFSIIVPVYNVAPYLRECLDSVLAQTFTDWECLCVNDGSTDESGTILDEYAGKDSRFRIFHKPNGGVSAARNLALDSVRGEWITFWDSDDVYDSGLLEAMCHIISKENAEIIRYSHTKFKDGEQCPRVSHTSPGSYSSVSGHDNVREKMLPIVIRAGYVRLFIKTKLVRENNIRFPLHVKCTEDTLFSLKAHFYAQCVVQTDYCGYYYRQRKGSAIGMHFPSLERLNFFKHFKEIVELYGSKQVLSKWGWMSLVSWIGKPADVQFQRELHILFKDMLKQKIIIFNHLPLYCRIPVLSYTVFNCRWVTRYTYLLIGFQWKVRALLKRLVKGTK